MPANGNRPSAEDAAFELSRSFGARLCDAYERAFNSTPFADYQALPEAVFLGGMRTAELMVTDEIMMLCN